MRREDVYVVNLRNPDTDYIWDRFREDGFFVGLLDPGTLKHAEEIIEFACRDCYLSFHRLCGVVKKVRLPEGQEFYVEFPHQIHSDRSQVGKDMLLKGASTNLEHYEGLPEGTTAVNLEFFANSGQDHVGHAKEERGLVVDWQWEKRMSTPLPFTYGDLSRFRDRYEGKLIPATIEEVWESSTEDLIVKAALRKGHTSILDHASVSFLLLGSRTWGNEEVRTRVGTGISQESQRYYDESREAEPYFVVPPRIAENKEAFELLVTHAGASHELYGKLRKLGIPAEDARFCTPGGAGTSIVMTYTFRALRNQSRLRGAPTAQWEIRRIALEKLAIMQAFCPIVFGDFVTGDVKVRGRMEPCAKSPIFWLSELGVAQKDAPKAPILCGEAQSICAGFEERPKNPWQITERDTEALVHTLYCRAPDCWQFRETIHKPRF